jgi:cysteine desulfurase/selenocysteine lyase
MLEQASQAALRSQAEQVVVVTGHDHHRIEQHLTSLPVDIAHNAAYCSGMASSISTGIRALDPRTRGVIIMLADMPLIQSQHLNRLIEHFSTLPDHSIVAPYDGERRGNPVLWGRSHFAGLQSLTGDQGGKHLLNEFVSHIKAVPMVMPGLTVPSAISTDFDTPENLLQAPHMELIRRQFPLLAQHFDHSPLCYLDSSATTPMPQIVIDSMQRFETHSRSNVGRGSHRLARSADQAYSLARQQVADYLNASSVDEIIFTSGTTMGVNLLANSLALDWQAGDEIIISQAEHHSNSLPWLTLAKRHLLTLKVIPLQADGRLDLNQLSALLTPKCRLIAVTHASNVTGAVSDIPRIAALAHQHGAEVLVDGAQAIAHGPINVGQLKADYYLFSGHKCYGPTGIGVIWGKQQALNKLTPFFSGGGMVQRLDLAGQTITLAQGTGRFEAGTPPISQAVGLGTALQWLSQLPWNVVKHQQTLMCRRLIDYISQQDHFSVLGPLDTQSRLPIITFAHDQHHAHDIGHLLDQQNIATRAGHHCAQPLMEHFDVMASTRVSLGIFNTMADIDHLIRGLQQAVAALDT